MQHVIIKENDRTHYEFCRTIKNIFFLNRTHTQRLSLAANRLFWDLLDPVYREHKKAPFIWVLYMMHCKLYRHCLIPLVTTWFTTMSMRVCNRIVTRISVWILMHMLEMLMMHICYMLRMNMRHNCFWKSMSLTTISRVYNWRHHIWFAMKHD